MNLVNMLCRDIKIPAHQLVHTFRAMDSLITKSSGINTQHYLSEIQTQSTAMNEVIDGLLFIVKIEEHRFHFQAIEKVDLRNLVKSSLKLVEPMLSLQKMSEKVRIETTLEHVLTSKYCMKTLFHYSIMAMFALISRNEIERLEHLLSEVVGAIFTIKAMPNQTFKHLLDIQIDVNPQLVGRLETSAEMDTSSTSLFHSCCMICNKIVETMMCDWSITTSSSVRFNVKFEMTCVDPDLTSSHYLSGHDSTAGGWRREVIRPQSAAKAHQIKAFLHTSAFAIINDAQSEPLFLDILHRLPGGKEITILRQAFSYHLKLYTLAIVQSIEACQQLRASKFTGLIILISEKLAYLDQRETALFNYGVPIPCYDRAFKELNTWLLKVNGDGDASDDEHCSVDSITNHLDTAISSGHSAVNKGKKEDKNKYSFCELMVLCAMQPISFQHMNSYIKWRYTNPGNNLWHHTVTIEFTAVCFLIVTICNVSMGLFSSNTALVAIFAIVVFLVLKNVYVFTTASKNRFWLWWYCIAMLDIASISFSLLTDFIAVSHFPSLVPVPPEGMQFTEFLSRKFGQFTGREIFFIIIMTPAIIRTLSEYSPWPWCFWFCLLRVARVFVLMVRMIRPVIYDALFMFLVAFVLTVNATIIAGLAMRERLSRRGFILLHEFVMAKDFRDRLLTVTRINLSHSLQSIITLHAKMMKDLTNACLQNNVFITLNLSDHVQSLALNVQIIQELSFHLQVTDPLYNKRPKTLFITAMKAHLLKDLTFRICSKFVQSSMELSVQIHLQLSPVLTMVRVDEELFTAILSNICRVAVQRIQELCQKSLQHRACNHEIVIWIEPLDQRPGEDVLKFTDVRTMVVTVVDTGIDLSPGVPDKHCVPPQHFLSLFNRTAMEDRLIASTNASVHLIGHSCAQLFDLPLRYHSGALIHPRYHTFQQIGIPYLLCPDSHKMQQWLEDEKKAFTFLGRSYAAYEMKYRKSFGGVIEELNTSDKQRYKSNLRAAIALARRSELLRQSFGTACFFTYYNKEVALRATKYYEMLTTLGWKSFSVHNLRYFPNSRSILELDCIIIDSTISFLCKAQRHAEIEVVASSSTSTSASEAENPGDQTTNGIMEFSFDAMDLLHYFRGKGYKGIIVLAHAEAALQSAALEKYKQKGGNNLRRLFRPNPYTHAMAADLHVGLPLKSQDVKTITSLCEEKMIRILLNAV